METLTPLPQNPTSCERGPEDRRPVLHLPRSRGAPGVLLLTLGPGLCCDVRLPPRYTRLLLAAADAWQADEGQLETFRGFRTAAELARHYGMLSEAGVSISEQAVRAYVYELKAYVAKQVSRRYPHQRIQVPPLLETQRGFGYRIARCGLVVVRPRPREALDN